MQSNTGSNSSHDDHNDNNCPLSLCDYTSSHFSYLCGEQYHGVSTGFNLLQYDDLNHVGFKDLSCANCDDIIMIHKIVKQNWILPTSGRKYGQNLIKLQSRVIITPLDDVTPQCV